MFFLFWFQKLICGREYRRYAIRELDGLLCNGDRRIEFFGEDFEKIAQEGLELLRMDVCTVAETGKEVLSCYCICKVDLGEKNVLFCFRMCKASLML